MRISGTLELASMTGAQYLKDFIDEIGGYINKCDFFIYYVMKHVNLWRFWITP